MAFRARTAIEKSGRETEKENREMEGGCWVVGVHEVIVRQGARLGAFQTVRGASSSCGARARNVTMRGGAVRGGASPRRCGDGYVC